jgi:Predicted membrane protein
MEGLIMKYISYTQLVMVIKIIIGSVFAIIVAQALQIEYSLSAGVVTLLTIQDTKKATLSITKKRYIAFVIAMIVVYISFSSLGFTIFSLFVFLTIFTSLSFLFQIQDGLSICVVLMTHFYMQQSVEIFWFINATSLMILGTSIGVLSNLYMPSISHRIKEKQISIESQMRAILKHFSNHLLDCSEVLDLRAEFDALEEFLEITKKEAYYESDNILRNEFTYYIRYIEMRQKQTIILHYMYSSMQLLKHLPKQANLVSKLLDKISKSLHEGNDAELLIDKLQQLIKELQQQELPKTRIEFEQRALLYNLLKQTEQFLEIKKQFIYSIR